MKYVARVCAPAPTSRTRAFVARRSDPSRFDLLVAARAKKHAAGASHCNNTKPILHGLRAPYPRDRMVGKMTNVIIAASIAVHNTEASTPTSRAMISSADGTGNPSEGAPMRNQSIASSEDTSPRVSSSARARSASHDSDDDGDSSATVIVDAFDPSYANAENEAAAVKCS